MHSAEINGDICSAFESLFTNLLEGALAPGQSEELQQHRYLRVNAN